MLISPKHSSLKKEQPTKMFQTGSESLSSSEVNFLSFSNSGHFQENKIGSMDQSSDKPMKNDNYDYQLVESNNKDYFDDIGWEQIETSDQSFPDVNWTMLTPRYPELNPWSPSDIVPQDVLETIAKNNLATPSIEIFPDFTQGTKSMAGKCGIPGPAQQIVGGEEATAHSYPWMAALFVDGKYFCGGTLISDEWVLTAAHCVDGNALEVRVLLGAHNIKDNKEEGRIDLSTMMFFTHPEYNPSLLQNDIALIHLINPIDFTSRIRPVCLPSHTESANKFEEMKVLASGWGRPADKAKGISPVLREVPLDTISNLDCTKQYPTVVNPKILCISGRGGKSTCKGDSGGPLYLVQNGTFMQVGITSFGSVFGCEVNMHAGFTRTGSYLKWIETETGIKIDL